MLRKDTQIYVLLDQSSCTGRIWKEITFVEAGHRWSGSNQRTIEDFLQGGENTERGKSMTREFTKR